MDDQVAGVEDQVIQNIDLLANDSDVDGDALTVVEVESSQGASITFNEDGTIDYVPLPNFVGTDTLTYTIEDGNGETSTATITVEIAGQNDLPTVPDLAFETDQDESLSGINVLDSAEDVDGDDLTITAGVSENGGLVNFDDDGQLTYTPPAGFVGTDVVTYTISDGAGGTTEATITITVNPLDGDGGLPRPPKRDRD